MLLTIIIGLVIWLAVPHLFDGKKLKKGQRKTVQITCQIIGVAIIVYAVISNFI